MSGGKKRAALQNLLQAFGIRSEVVDDEIDRVGPNYFAIVESSSKGITLACEIQQLAPKCRCIFLTSTISVLTPAAIETRISEPLFIVQPVTVRSLTINYPLISQRVRLREVIESILRASMKGSPRISESTKQSPGVERMSAQSGAEEQQSDSLSSDTLKILLVEGK
jgi:hypothetical protein